MKTLSFDPIRADVAITEKEKSAALHANALLHNGQGAVSYTHLTLPTILRV